MLHAGSEILYAEEDLQFIDYEYYNGPYAEFYKAWNPRFYYYFQDMKLKHPNTDESDVFYKVKQSFYKYSMH